MYVEPPRLAAALGRGAALVVVLVAIGVLVVDLVAAGSADLRDQVPVTESRHATTGPRFPLCGVGYVRPTAFKYPCTGTQQLWLELRWQMWSRTEAEGIGEYWSPGPAGQFSSFPVRLRLSDVSEEGGHAVFTRLTVAFPGQAPDGAVGVQDVYSVIDGALTPITPVR